MEPLFVKGDFCGFCRKTGDLKTCQRCKLAQYCSQNCQGSDFARHKGDCKSVGFYSGLISEVEPYFENFNYGNDGNPPENLFQTQIGEFWWIKNRSEFEKPFKHPWEIWPRDYLVLRKRLAEAMWRIASSHENYEAAEKVLKELLEILRLDSHDGNMTCDMIPHIFLYLGRLQESYNFAKFQFVHFHGMKDFLEKSR